jgi:glycosyltransferase involved in cell wall biosynthesis
MPGKREPVCCIIPAFDEAGRVGRVVSLALSSGLFEQVLVVDDGSSDGTAKDAEQAGARVLRQIPNQGKAAALRTGLRQTTEPILCFLDADLRSVSVEHLHSLVSPVVSGVEVATIAVFRGGLGPTTLAQQISPMISGQRCLRRELLDGFDHWDSGYGIETSINAHLQKLEIEQHIVEWYGASHVMKEEKRGLLRGSASRLKMFFEISSTWLRTKFSRKLV